VENKQGETMKQIAIIGIDETITQKVAPLLDNKKIFIKYIVWKRVNLSLFNNINCLYIDDKLERNYKEDIFHFCNKNKIRLWIFPSGINLICSKIIKQKGNMLMHEVLCFESTKCKRVVKRIFDIIFSIFAIIILLPLMVLICVLIRTSDYGPAIYRQKRLTINKKEFILYKFRTMVYNAEKKTGIILSPRNDKRVTKVGKVLRKTRLDELPQLFNVLMGDMSVVGPRPERKYFVLKYEKQNNYYRYRFHVKAGITGLSQIQCCYHTNYLDKLNFDLLYINRYNLLLDILIIFKTIKVLFNKRFAEGVGLYFNERLKLRNLRGIMLEPGLLELREINENNSTNM